MRVEPISPATQEAALEYLSPDPYRNVFIRHILLNDLAESSKNVVVVLDERNIRGAAYFGRQLVVAADPAALRPLAECLRGRRGTRMIVGPRDTVRAFWELVRNWHARPRVVRDRQLVMMVDRGRLAPYERRTMVAQATIEQWRAVADASAQMIRQELASDPRRGSADFDRGVRAMIEANLWWVGVADGRLCFFCNVGPWCTTTAQLQGIWTPPELRGRGLATASLAAICDRLLHVTPTLSLYVNDFNHDAIALYRRVGFEDVGEFQTILF